MTPTVKDRPAGTLTSAELREARRGFTLMLRRKRFSPAWIEKHADDLLAQAHSEYAEYLAAGRSAYNPAGWLIVCAWRRAQHALESESRRPHVASLETVLDSESRRRRASLETVFHLADESTPSPAQQAIDHDRHARLRKALSHLPEKECKLMALVYFEGYSIREAGRKLGWQKSVANRHHAVALERLRALISDRTLLSPATLGLGAWVAVIGEGHRRHQLVIEAATSPARKAVAIGAESASAVIYRFAELARKLLPLSDGSNAAALSGAGRAAGYCGAAAGVLACGLAASGIVGPGIRAAPAPQREIAKPVPSRTRSLPESSPGDAVRVQTISPAQPQAPAYPQHSSTRRARSVDRTAASVKVKPTAHETTARAVLDEFGVKGESGSTSEGSPAPPSSPTVSSASPRSATPPRSSAPPAKADPSPAAPEFGF